MERPTVPAPAIATRMGHPSVPAAPGSAVEDVAPRSPDTAADVEEVVLLVHGVRRGQHALAERVRNATRQPAACSSAQTGGRPRSRAPALGDHDRAGRVAPLEDAPSGSSIRISWSVVHGTVATVGMPSRS